MEALPASRVPELVGGIVAHNEERRIGEAIRSLLEQDLGGRARWGTIWVIASGCTDRTVERVREQAESDVRVHLIEEPKRTGKARALNAVFERARGDLLVLLNGDAVADPGSVRELLRIADGLTPPYAIMGGPLPPPTEGGRALEGAANILWRVHEEVHRDTLEAGDGNHLSDELLLVSLPILAPLSPDTINDGASLGATLGTRGGQLRYATEARVRIEVPRTVEGYLRQRRRIYAGHAQIARDQRVLPTTLLSLAVRQPRRAWRLLGRCWKADSSRTSFLLLAGLEAIAIALALWDQLPPRRDHARWRRVADTRSWTAGSGLESSRT